MANENCLRNTTSANYKGSYSKKNYTNVQNCLISAPLCIFQGRKQWYLMHAI
jgi:hypothetical protein